MECRCCGMLWYAVVCWNVDAVEWNVDAVEWRFQSELYSTGVRDVCRIQIRNGGALEIFVMYVGLSNQERRSIDTAYTCST